MPKSRPPDRQHERGPKAVSAKEAQIIRNVAHRRKGLHEKLAKQ